jgi:DNA-binding NarL/FixJ family response regulator
LFSAIRAQPWTFGVSFLAKRLGLNVARVTAGAGAKAARTTLTHTEVQLAQLLRQGLANRRISAVLHYSAKTIEVYMSRLYQKVGCHSRLELVLVAERLQDDRRA